MQLAHKKTCQLILETENHYLGALKGNQGNLHKRVQANFVAEASYIDLSKGHGRLEKRVVSICTTLDDIKPWPGLKTLIRVESERHPLPAESFGFPYGWLTPGYRPVLENSSGLPGSSDGEIQMGRVPTMLR